MSGYPLPWGYRGFPQFSLSKCRDCTLITAPAVPFEVLSNSVSVVIRPTIPHYRASLQQQLSDGMTSHERGRKTQLPVSAASCKCVRDRSRVCVAAMWHRLRLCRTKLIYTKYAALTWRCVTQSALRLDCGDQLVDTV